MNVDGLAVPDDVNFSNPVGSRDTHFNLGSGNSGIRLTGQMTINFHIQKNLLPVSCVAAPRLECVPYGIAGQLLRQNGRDRVDSRVAGVIVTGTHETNLVAAGQPWERHLEFRASSPIADLHVPLNRGAVKHPARRQRNLVRDHQRFGFL